MEFRKELAKLSMERIGGTAEQKRQFFDEIIAKYPDVYWIDGCPAPTVRSKLMHFNLKPGAVPKATRLAAVPKAAPVPPARSASDEPPLIALALSDEKTAGAVTRDTAQQMNAGAI